MKNPKNKKTKDKKIMEYEEAPSGSVYFYNYKEPLMRFEKGFGYFGAVLFDESSDKIQCHFCGKWFIALGNHIYGKHKVRAAEYKRTIGLNNTTALIGEKLRAKLIAHGHEVSLRNLRPGGKMSQGQKDKIRATLKENRFEKQNTSNTCPEQLLERLVDLYNRLGRLPRRKEIPFIETIRKVYGTFKEACRIAGLPYRKPGGTLGEHFRYKKLEDIIIPIADFYQENGVLPNAYKIFRNKNDFRNQLKRFNVTAKEVYSRALAYDGIYKPDVKYQKSARQRTTRFHYTKEELLRFLQTFEKINGRRPSVSDTKRRLLPYVSRYIYHFGSWPNALKMAFGY